MAAAKPGIQQQATALYQTLEALIDDPSIPESTKVRTIIHATSLTCAIVACQPLPFADLVLLTPIQVAMVMALSRAMGRPMGRHGANELVASLLGVVGWGVLAQQVILGLYKTVVPFLGAVTTVPLVYAATWGLGWAAHAILDARRRDQTLTDEEVRRIAAEARERAKAEQRDWSVTALREELAALRAQGRDYQAYIAKLEGITRTTQEAEAERGRLAADLAAAQERLAGLTAALARRDDALRRLREQAARGEQARGETAKLERELAAANAQIEEWSGKAATAEQRRVEAEQQVASLQEGVEEWFGKAATEEQRRVEAERLAASLQEAVTAKQAQLERLQSTVADQHRKRVEVLRDRWRQCYRSVALHEGVWDYVGGLPDDRLLAFERRLGELEHSPTNVRPRCTVEGTAVREADYAGTGRFYYLFRGAQVTVLRVGDKNTQSKDLAWLRSHP